MKTPGADLDRAAMLAFYEGRITRWQIPDDVVFVDEIPHTATGKMLKLKPRQQFEGHAAVMCRAAGGRLLPGPPCGSAAPTRPR